MIRVLLVHDICLFRWALTEVLDRENDIDVSAATTRDATERVRAVRPDVCVVDAESPEPTGHSILRKISKLAKGKGPGKSPACWCWARRTGRDRCAGHSRRRPSGTSTRRPRRCS